MVRCPSLGGSASIDGPLGGGLVVVYDKYVTPRGRVTNYRTKWSGITRDTYNHGNGNDNGGGGGQRQSSPSSSLDDDDEDRTGGGGGGGGVLPRRYRLCRLIGAAARCLDCYCPSGGR